MEDILGGAQRKMISAPTENGKKVLTMSEYIEREAISEEIRKYYYKNPPNFSYGEGFDRGLNRAQRAILDAPTADVAPVRHGRWGTNSDRPDSLICSVCNCGFDMWKHDPHNYCPNCGAKMEE